MKNIKVEGTWYIINVDADNRLWEKAGPIIIHHEDCSDVTSVKDQLGTWISTVSDRVRYGPTNRNIYYCHFCRKEFPEKLRNIIALYIFNKTHRRDDNG